MQPSQIQNMGVPMIVGGHNQPISQNGVYYQSVVPPPGFGQAQTQGHVPQIVSGGNSIFNVPPPPLVFNVPPPAVFGNNQYQPTQMIAVNGYGGPQQITQCPVILPLANPQIGLAQSGGVQQNVQTSMFRPILPHPPVYQTNENIGSIQPGVQMGQVDMVQVKPAPMMNQATAVPAQIQPAPAQMQPPIIPLDNQDDELAAQVLIF